MPKYAHQSLVNLMAVAAMSDMDIDGMIEKHCKPENKREDSGAEGQAAQRRRRQTERKNR